MKKLYSAILALLLGLSVCTCSLAEGGTVTLAELKATAPESVSFTIDGQVYDAPVILPEGEALPTLVCRRAAYNATALEEKYPNDPKDGPDSWRYDGSPVLGVLKFKSQSSERWLNAGVDQYQRAVLPLGQQPPQCQVSPGEALAIYNSILRLCGGDPQADVRVYRAFALSGFYRTKSEKYTSAETGVSFRASAVDLTKPLTDHEKGKWQLILTQYLHGAPVFPETYRYTSMAEVYANGDQLLSPVFMLMDLDGKDNFTMDHAMLREEGVLTVNAAFLPFDAMRQIVQERIDAGQLQSVYELSLGYTIALASGDAEFTDASISEFNMDARYVLYPVWNVTGYDLKNKDGREWFGYTPPDPNTCFGYGQTDRGPYELRINAVTGELVSSNHYDLEANVQ